MGKDELLESLGAPYLASFFQFVEPTIPARPQFHYTTWAGLQGIISSKELWAFDVRGMVDLLEVEHGFQLLEKLLRGRSDKISGLVIPHIRNDAGRQIYAACFSSEGDDAAQWDRYAARGAGYAIEFDPDALYRTIDHTLLPHATEIRYTNDGGDLSAVINRLDNFLKANEKDIVTLSSDDANKVAKNVVSWMGLGLLRNCAGLKSPAYRSEAEWRILLSAETKIVELPQGPRQVISAGTWTPDDCPIRGVIVGPRNPPETLRTLQRWLEASGYNAWTEEGYSAVIADADEEEQAAINESYTRGIVVRRSDLHWR